MTGSVTRRQVLQWAGGAAAVTSFLPLLAACSSQSGGAGSSTGTLLGSSAKLPPPFQAPLPTPPVLQPVGTDGTTDYYEITQTAAQARFLPETTTEIWGYNGSFPGPTIEARSGRRVVVRHRNGLPVPLLTTRTGPRG